MPWKEVSLSEGLGYCGVGQGGGREGMVLFSLWRGLGEASTDGFRLCWRLREDGMLD